MTDKNSYINNETDAIDSILNFWFSKNKDITKSIECKNLIDETLNQYDRIDLLILGAGISMWTPFEKISDTSFYCFSVCEFIDIFSYRI